LIHVLVSPSQNNHPFLHSNKNTIKFSPQPTKKKE
jgi:hypothetical protein